MAKIFNPNKSSTSHRSKHRKHKSLSKQLPDFVGTITNYDPEARGIIKSKDNRITFVSGAILGEQVKVRPLTYTDKLIKAETIAVINKSEQRITPQCQYFETCGGCQLQYLNSLGQLSAKQSGLEPMLAKQLNLTNIPWQKSISGEQWHYRRSARLAIWFQKNGSFNLGFRKQNSKDIIDIEQCLVLAKPLSDIIPKLKQLIAQLKSKRAITHLQLLYLTNENTVIFRVTKDITKQDKILLERFSDEHSINILLEHNEQHFEPLSPKTQQNGTLLEYQVGNIRYQFQPNNFIQVNEQINQEMLAQALTWLDVKSTDLVLDLFSGVGNFTLPIAHKAKHVIAVEGVNSMVKQIKHNAELNQLSNVSAFQADLSEISDKYKPQWLKPIDKLLLDPARDGAFEVVKKIPLLKPKQILYVSCNPATLVRDIKVLKDANYELTKIGLLNMFPHTSHVEAMALLEYK